MNQVRLERCPRRPVRLRERFLRSPDEVLLSALRLFLAVSISAFFSRNASAWSCCSSTVKTMPRRRASLRSIRQPYLPLLACVRAARAARAALRLSVGAGTIQANGLTFDSTKVLSTLMGRGVVVPDNYSRDAARREGDNAAMAMKSVVVDPARTIGKGDRVLRRPSSRTIIYEMHVRGFTRHPSSGVSEKTRGTYAGLIEKNSIFSATGHHRRRTAAAVPVRRPGCPAGRVNYWGYAPIAFFAPHQGYSSRQDPLGPVNEFVTWSRPCTVQASRSFLTSSSITRRRRPSRAHTEFSRPGQRRYYILEPDRSRYANYSGAGKR